MWKNLQRLMTDIPEIHIDNQGSLKDWYYGTLDDLFFKKPIDHLRDPNLPVQERPNCNDSFNPRGSHQMRNQRTDSPPRQSES